MLPLLGLSVHVSGSGRPPTWFIVLAAAIVLLSIAASVWTAQYGQRKGLPFFSVLLAALLISFPIVLLIVALVPSRQPPLGSMPPHWRKW